MAPNQFDAIIRRDCTNGETVCYPLSPGIQLGKCLSKLVFPKPRKPIQCQRGVPSGALQIAMTQVVRKRSGVVVVVGELVAGAMPKHVRMH
jgi:hypothetical protein